MAQLGYPFYRVSGRSPDGARAGGMVAAMPWLKNRPVMIPPLEE